jgi:hypothetical protein
MTKIRMDRQNVTYVTLGTITGWLIIIYDWFPLKTCWFRADNRVSFRSDVWFSQWQVVCRSYIPLDHTYPSIIRTPRSYIRSYIPLDHTYPSIIHTPRSYIRSYIPLDHTPRYYIPLDHTYPSIIHTPRSYIPLDHTYPSIIHTPRSYIPLDHTPRYYIPLDHTYPSIIHTIIHTPRSYPSILHTPRSYPSMWLLCFHLKNESTTGICAMLPMAEDGTAGIIALAHGTLLKLQNYLFYYWIIIVVVLFF